MLAGFFKQNRKTMLIAALCLCMAVCAVGGVIAYLTTETDPISNEFVPAKVTCAVEESFEDGVKENVCVRNTGNVDAYLRAAVVVTFVSDDGKVFSTAPVEGVNYTVTWGDADWQKGTDGYWYHQTAVSPDTLTAPLIKTAKVVSAPVGYRLHIQIVASAIQSAPDAAVKEAWGVTPDNGTLTVG